MKPYISPEELERRRSAAQANARARREAPFKPEPFSQGPHARAAHAAPEPEEDEGMDDE